MSPKRVVRLRGDTCQEIPYPLLPLTALGHPEQTGVVLVTGGFKESLFSFQALALGVGSSRNRQH